MLGAIVGVVEVVLVLAVAGALGGLAEFAPAGVVQTETAPGVEVAAVSERRHPDCGCSVSLDKANRPNVSVPAIS